MKSQKMSSEIMMEGIIMEQNKLTEANEKIAGTITTGFKKMSDGVADGFNKMSEGVVKGYTKVEDAFVGKLFTKEGETVEEAKARMKQAAEEQRKAHEEAE